LLAVTFFNVEPGIASVAAILHSARKSRDAPQCSILFVDARARARTV
jgi:hypothetical protein